MGQILFSTFFASSIRFNFCLARARERPRFIKIMLTHSFIRKYIRRHAFQLNASRCTMELVLIAIPSEVECVWCDYAIVEAVQRMSSNGFNLLFSLVECFNGGESL